MFIRGATSKQDSSGHSHRQSKGIKNSFSFCYWVLFPKICIHNAIQCHCAKTSGSNWLSLQAYTYTGSPCAAHKITNSCLHNRWHTHANHVFSCCWSCDNAFLSTIGHHQNLQVRLRAFTHTNTHSYSTSPFIFQRIPQQEDTIC